MNTARKYLLFAWLAFASTAFVLVCAAAQCLNQRRALAITAWMAKWWAQGMLRITGTRCQVEGLSNVQGTGPYVIMANHRSHLDTAVLIRHMPFLFGFIVKEELMRIPIFASGMRTIGCVGISRSKAKADHAVMDSVALEVASGKNILVFPEGTRAPTDDFLPFRKGGVVMAIKAGVPILPIGLSGTGRIIPARVLSIQPGPVMVRFGKPIPTDALNLDDRAELLNQVQCAIESLYIPNFPQQGVGSM
ncbi:MAG: lysophospholipid acyltransferase family protein [Myxococcota bacterium]|nr:lysophospholipid acyltransferase family protein [Myxococcota bacterium]